MFSLQLCLSAVLLVSQCVNALDDGMLPPPSNNEGKGEPLWVRSSDNLPVPLPPTELRELLLGAQKDFINSPELDVSLDERQTSSKQPSYGVNLDLLGAKHPAGKLRAGQATFTDSCSLVTAVPTALTQSANMYPPIPAFYTKYTQAYGIPIIGSNNVTDLGLKRACYCVKFLFASRYDARNVYYKLYGRIALIGDGEQQTTLPEYSTWDPTYWNTRARGLGPTFGIPLSSAGDDNQRCANSDRYWDQDILVHELTHGLQLLASAFSIQGFARELGNTFRKVMATGKFAGLYAATNPEEYFAAGAQMYHCATSGFTWNAPLPGGGTTTITDRATLSQYDPDLITLLNMAYPCAAPSCTPWVERCAWRKNNPQVLNLATESTQVVSSLCTTGPQGTSRCVVPTASQQTCGPSGTTSAQCAAIGCCWSNSVCFYPLQDCNDLDLNCPSWAVSGECPRNPGYMYRTCPFSCGRCSEVKTLAAGTLANLCQDLNGNCIGWASGGQCTANPAYMNSQCGLACKKCTVTDPFP